MSLLRAGASALGKLVAVVVLAAAFLTGMVGVVYLSLRGEEVKVPEIVGKDVNESEKELAALGLKLKKRASRYSEEKPNTILEQLPRSGDTVKTGQTILVVVAQANPESTEAPATVKKDDEVETVESGDKPKNSNKNTGKRPEKTRDVISSKNKNSNTANANVISSETNSKSSSANTGSNRNGSTPAANKPAPVSPSKSPAPKPTGKPAATNGDTRNRREQ